MAVYDAFISYSHAKDQPIADALQSVVQRLGKPWYQRRALRIFRDDTSLSATPQLWPSITKALDASRFLILLASPEAAASPWVEKEVAYWLEHKSADTLLIALTAGTLAWDNAAGDFAWSPATPLPAILKGRFGVEPKWVDLGGYRDGGTARDLKFMGLGADFAAAIHGVPKEDLLSQELRQQRRALTLAWSAAATLFVLAGLAGWQWQVASVQRERAETALTTATGTANTLIFELAQEFRDRAGMPVDLVRKILERARELQKQLTESGETAPGLRRSEAAGLAEMAVALRARGAIPEGLELAGQCRTIMESLLARAPSDVSLQLELADCYLTLGDLLADAGRREEALASHRSNLAIREKLVAVDPTNPKWQFQLSVAYHRVGNLLAREQALAAFERALAISEKLAADDPKDSQIQQDLGVSYNKVANMLMAAGHRVEALAAYRKSLAVFEKLAAREPENTLWKQHLALSYQNVGDTLRASGQNAEALAAYQAALAIRERLAADDPARATWQRELASSHGSIADVLAATGRADEALASYRAGLAIIEKLVAQDPDNPLWQRDLTIAENKIGDLHLTARRFEEALAHYRKSLLIREKLATADAGNTERQLDLAFNYGRIAQALGAMGRNEEALANLQRSTGIIEKLAAADPENAEWQHFLSVNYSRMASLLAALRRPAEALEYYRKDLAIALAAVAVDPSNPVRQHDLWKSYYTLGNILRDLDQPESARASYRDGLAIIDKLASSDPRNVQWQTELAVNLFVLAKLDDDPLARLTRALAVIRTLEAENRLPADKKSWPSILEQAIAALPK